MKTRVLRNITTPSNRGYLKPHSLHSGKMAPPLTIGVCTSARIHTRADPVVWYSSGPTLRVVRAIELILPHPLSVMQWHG